MARDEGGERGVRRGGRTRKLPLVIRAKATHTTIGEEHEGVRTAGVDGDGADGTHSRSPWRGCGEHEVIA